MGFRDGEDRALGALVADHAEVILIGLAGESACVFQQVGERFRAGQLIEHRAFDLAGHEDQVLIGRDNDDIAFAKVDVTVGTAVEEVSIDVDRSNLLAAADHLDGAHRSVLLHAAGMVERIENRGERGQAIGARHLDLAHHVDLDGADVAQRDAHGGVGPAAADAGILGDQGAAQFLTGFLDGQPADLDLADLADIDRPFRGDRLGIAVFAVSVDVDLELVAGTEQIILRRRQVLVRLE